MNDSTILEKDLEALFHSKTPSGKYKKVKTFFLYVFVFIASCLIIYLVTNFQSLKTNLAFWYENEYKTDSTANTQPIFIEKNQTNNTKPNLPEIADNSVYISILNIKAPITWKIPNKPEQVKDGLVNGVIHIDGTALPGETGNVFITGHSSNYPWAKGNYNNIFALINKLVVGDLVQLKYKNVDYVYKVSDIKVVEPSDISVLAPTADPSLTLMTCTPVGTSLRRLIIISKQIYPDPKQNTGTNSTSGSSNKLPNVR